MKIFSKFILLCLLACITMLGQALTQTHHQRVDIIRAIGLHVNFEMEKSRDENMMLLEHSQVKADINIERANPRRPLNLAKLKIVQDEELFRCDNLTLRQPKFMDTIECEGIDSPANNPRGETSLRPGYIRGIDYVRRQGFYFRMKSKRFPAINSAGETNFYRLKDRGVLSGIDAALDKYKQGPLSFGKLKLDIGYYVETSFQFDNSDTTYSCSGDLYFSMNRTALLKIGPHDFWPDYFIWLFYYTLEWHHGFMVNINGFNCTQNIGKLYLKSDLLYIQKQQFPYRFMNHQTLVTPNIIVIGNITQQQSLTVPELEAEGFIFNNPDVEKLRNNHKETQTHQCLWSGQPDVFTFLTRVITTIQDTSTYEASSLILTDVLHIPYTNSRDWKSGLAEGELALFDIRDRSTPDSKQAVFHLKYSEDVYKNYDLRIKKKFSKKFQDITSILELFGINIKGLFEGVSGYHYHDEL